ncbi:LysE family translocator [Spirochaeta thermophila]|uniref:Lysine exporter protein n=1 Tax=Winmispira thermophila (strain ATCC 49972 / DSM 6192 / RI 19.B1) TaxID=665571 RepID=E0RTP9_WINT6|nr:LysE family translocator [Spirochaeta thermophila]ADN02424.1 lysine exporter protein [Spirochaeta thermophila DSM 6192]
MDLIATTTFVLITSLTPGPNNISSASMALSHGYRNTLPYLLGISTGFFILLTIASLLSTLILQHLSWIEVPISLLGGLYILWLAVHILKAQYDVETKPHPPLGFPSGLLLQFVNPKGLIYALALHTTFLRNLPKTIPWPLTSSLLLAFITFLSVSLWALGGSAIRTRMSNERARLALNITLAVLLASTALSLWIHALR